MKRSPVRALAAVLVAVLLLSLPRPARCAWPHDPAVGLPVCTAYATQRWTAMTTDGEGGAIIAWMDGRGADWDIYAQRVSADGRALWTADGVPLCTAAGTQVFPVIAGDGAGGAIVAWEDGRPDYGGAYAQRVTADGEARWTADGVRLCDGAYSQANLAILSTLPSSPGAANGAVIVWKDARSGVDDDLYAQRVSPDGMLEFAASGLPVCVATGYQGDPRIVTDGGGGAIVAWYDLRSGGDIYAQRISSWGTTSWTTDGLAVCTASGYQTSPTLVPDGGSGVIVAWSDYRGDDWEIYAQYVSGSGVPQWPADGVAVCAGIGMQWMPAIVADGVGGAFVFWQDQRGGVWDVYGQRISSIGATQWTAGGLAVCSAPGEQTEVQAAPDGLGGALVAWLDARAGVTDVYVQRMSAGGAAQWTAGGVPVGTASSNQSEARLLADGTGGGLLAWADQRAGDGDVYAQRVDRWGYLGAEPAIAGVRDVPNDQGGKVKLFWDASPLDTDPLFECIGSYRVYRSVPSSEAVAALAAGQAVTEDEAVTPDGCRVLLALAEGAETLYWEYLASVIGDHLPGYSYLAPTTSDSLPASNPLTLFMVQARSMDGTKWWNSAPDSGYSVDDLAPATPLAFTGEYASGLTTLRWEAGSELDLLGYRLHRGRTAVFAPDEGNLVAALDSTGYVDAAPGPYYYKLCAVDVHGNVSPYATLLPSGTVDVAGPALPRAVFLVAPAPNPARGAATLRFGLPREARAELALYDQQGRRVRSLLAGTQPAGEHAVTWDGRGEDGRALPAGLYFVRLEVEGRAHVTRLAVIR